MLDSNCWFSYSASNFESPCSEYHSRNNHKPAEARGHVAIYNTQILHCTSTGSLAEGWQKLSSASGVMETHCALIHWLRHEAIGQRKAVCGLGDGRGSGVLHCDAPDSCVGVPAEDVTFSIVISESSLTSNDRAPSPAKWFWKPANSLAMELHLVTPICSAPGAP